MSPHFLNLFYYLFMCICSRVYARVLGGQKWVSDALELEFQVVVKCLLWVLALNLSPPEASVSLKHRATSLTLHVHFQVSSDTL